MPIVVTTISRQAVSASTWKPMSTLKLPAGIHVAQRDVQALLAERLERAGGRARRRPSPTSQVSDDRRRSARRSAAPRPNRQLEPAAEQGGEREAGDRQERAGSARSRDQRCGRRQRASCRLLPHRVVLVDERRLPVAVDRDHDRQADGRLGRGGRHHDQRDDRRAGRAGATLGERAERDDRRG